MNRMPTTVSVKSPASDYILDQLKKHGLLFVFLAGAVWWLMDRQDKLEAKIENCNSELIRILEEDRTTMVQVIESNTKAIQRIEAKIQ
jgi:hypothetical protein